MRKTVDGGVLSVRAIAGLHVVTLAWDFIRDWQVDIPDLMGFAIERSELDVTGKVVERYWLRGMKRFRLKDEGLPAGSLVPTSEHPIQTFQWGDYTAKPGVTYRYRIVPTRGKVKHLLLDDAASTTVEIATETSPGPSDPLGVRHEIHFNRGAAGSQAYARKFGSKRPDDKDPESDQMVWLSRGLFEALVGFIGHAAGGDAARYKLRAMLYEFRYAPVGQAFKSAAEAGADVDIRYEAQSYKTENEEMIQAVGIGHVCFPQKDRPGIRHNKFIVLIRDDVPVAVWTGSTNISAGGIFGHSNVGHAVWDEGIARRYLDYWNALIDPNVTTVKLRFRNRQVEATPKAGATPPAEHILTLFSPRDLSGSDVAGTTLSWYAELLASAKQIACMTFAFNFDPLFEKAVQGETDALTYLVFDKSFGTKRETEVQQNKNTIFAIGSKLNKNDIVNFIGENLTGFNRNYYIHDKFILADPLTDDPIVVTGTANFSSASQINNDENMLVIRGNQRVADIYFGEFMRIFDHHYSRYLLHRQQAETAANASAGFLNETPEDWVPEHFAPGPKQKRRCFFMGRPVTPPN